MALMCKRKWLPFLMAILGACVPSAPLSAQVKFGVPSAAANEAPGKLGKPGTACGEGPSRWPRLVPVAQDKAGYPQVGKPSAWEEELPMRLPPWDLNSPNNNSVTRRGTSDGGVQFLPPPTDSAQKKPTPGAKGIKFILPTAQPTPDELFRLESEAQLFKRMNQEYLKTAQKKVLFPKDASPREPALPYAFPPASVFWETASICHKPRYFSDENPEQFGLYHPCIQPFCSTARFYLDTLGLPLRILANPPCTWRCVDLVTNQSEISP